MGKAEFGVLFRIFFFWIAASTLGTAIIYLYLQQEGLDTSRILLYGLVYFLAPSLILLLGTRGGFGALRWGILSQAAAFVALAALGGLGGALASAIIGAAAFSLFWAPFNALWFTHKSGGNAGSGALFFSVVAIAGIFGPAAAGLVAEGWGFPALFAAAAIVLLPALALAWKKTGDFRGSLGRAHIGPSEGLSELRGFRTLVFMEGFGGAGLMVLIPIITLEYFSDPLGLGMFFSAAGLLSILLSFLFARISDEKMERRKFLLFTSAGFGAGMVLCAAAYEPLFWFAGVVMAIFFKNVFFPFSTAILVDTKRKMSDIMYGRELVLNLGRVLGVLLAIGVYLFCGDLRLPLLLCGLSLFAYGAIFEFLKKKTLEIV
jgi:predicted MFS family arabinose efflux permease